MREKCDIVQDLLPIYLDGELREGTKHFVEDHLKECIKCKQVLDDSFAGEELFRNTIKDSRLDAISGRRMWYKSMLKYLVKPAFWVLLISLICVIIFATILSRPNLLHYEILTTAATAEEMLHPGFFKSSINREGDNALNFYLEKFSAPSDTIRSNYQYRVSLVNDSIILDRLYSFVDSSVELYYPDVATPQPVTMDTSIVSEMVGPAQFTLSFNRFVSLPELEVLFNNSEIDILWLGIATRDLWDSSKWLSSWDNWGLPVYFLKNNIKNLKDVVEDEMRNRVQLFTDYNKYLAGIDPYMSQRLSYVQENGINVYGVIVRAKGPEILEWLEKYPLVRYFRRMS
ncbi:MAG: anti sigma factor C-terminal domain-containing protein [Firmicutes bacterium]|nr:anti sigma factor C-terminal domain-containing protein [Bacillota bacterium]MDD4264324.1 anti sigma factor C-terminal domain-containing protein [Bacillota bacterium]MDD4694308.1 anti sigma factor C-terminal domain-containing protein [Bacillota bacterium]